MEVLSSRGMRDFIGMKYFKKFAFFLLLLLFLVCYAFIIISSESVEDDGACAFPGCLGKRQSTTRRGKLTDSMVLEEIWRVLEEDTDPKLLETVSSSASMGDFIGEMKSSRPDATSFALKLKAMVSRIESKARAAKIEGYLYRHVASNSIPKPLHCLSLTLAEEYSTNADARQELPPPPQATSLTDNTLRHVVIASDNVLATAAVAASLAEAAAEPSRTVLHVVTDKKVYAAMYAWFSLHPLGMVVEVREVGQFECFGKRKGFFETMERDRSARVKFGGGSAAILEASRGVRPGEVAARLQTLSPKYYSMMNHIRINLPEMFPHLKKVVFLDDDVIVQADLSPLWEIDLKGGVNGAVETCKGGDSFVMSKRLKNYLNFSHPLIASSFDPEECAWAYGMNIFDLEAWRNTNITRNYHHWLRKNVESGLSLWKLGTLPPGLIAFHGHVHIIDHHWHMLGLGYQEKTSLEEAKKAAVIHFNGRAKPWLDIAFPHLKSLWTKHLPFTDRFLRACDITGTL